MSGTWEIVCDVESSQVRRLAVPGGWLYQVEDRTHAVAGRVGDPNSWSFGWTAPVFVADTATALDAARKMISELAP